MPGTQQRQQGLQVTQVGGEAQLLVTELWDLGLITSLRLPHSENYHGNLSLGRKPEP